MEVALTALRQFSLGTVSEATVYRTAAAVAAAKAPVASLPEVEAAKGEEECEEGADAEAPAEPPAEAAAPAEPPEEASGEVVSELYTWGRAKNYQLGFGASGEEQLVPRLVPMPKGVSVRSISCGQFHSVVVTTCGSLFSWGFSGATGRLGLDSADGSAPASCIEPSRLPDFGHGRHHVAVKAAAGLNHSLALTSAGAVLSWGSNMHGQLGLQGVKTGESAGAQRPQLVKGPLKGEVVVDIAAGLGHSLCCTEAGAAFSWGSNERGALGLGVPPAVPAQASSPQRLPLLKGIWAVFSSAAGHASAALGSGHGDALLFGCATERAGRGGGAAAAADPKHFVPSRVFRRRGRASSGSEAEAWQTAQRTSAPLRSVVLGSEEAFGVDADGLLWAWPLRGQRPCSAEEALFPEAPAPSPAGRVRSVAVADRIGALWAADSGPGACLWRLKRAEGGWSADRYEHLAQVSHIACGPEHQSAIVSFRRTEEVLPLRRGAHERESDDEESGTEEESEAGEEGALVQPASLQQLCEEKLCREVSPRSLGLLCDAALEFDRPTALDRAFAFLRANAPLMFSRQHLPVLSQLPVDVLAAFELVAGAKFSTPSAALEAYPAGFPFEDMATVPEVEAVPKEDSSGALPAKEGTIAKASGQRRKRRSSGLGGTPKLQEAATPQQAAATSPMAKAAAASPALLPAAAAAVSKAPLSNSMPSPGAGSLPSPLVGPGTANLAPVKAGSPSAKPASEAAPPDWVTVQARRKAGSGVSAGSPAAAHAPSPLLPSSAATAVVSPKLECLAPPAVPARPMPTLGDFVRPPAGQAGPSAAGRAAGAGPPAAEGPSAALSAAVRSIQADGARPAKAGWATAAEEAQEAAPRLRDILKAEGGGRGAQASAPRGSGAQDATTCSWGRDAMPSEKPKGRSVYEIQEQEAAECARRREEEEILEFEAMFAALEVAERADTMEQTGGSASSKAPKTKKAAKQPSGAEKGKDKRPAPEDGQQPSRSGGWASGGQSAWRTRGPGRGGGGGGWDSWSGRGWDWSEESWQWSEPAGERQRWVPKQQDP